MERLLKNEIRKNNFQNSNTSPRVSLSGTPDYQNTQMFNMDDAEEIMKRCYNKIEDWMKQEDDEFFNKCLENLGLCEKKGLDGQIMLYPIKAKEKKLEKEEFHSMIKRLYKVRNDSNEFIHVNEETKNSILSLRNYKREKSKKRSKKSLYGTKKTESEKNNISYPQFF